MREIPDKMSSNGPAKFPTRLFGFLLRDLEESRPGHVWIGIKLRFDFLPRRFEIVA